MNFREQCIAANTTFAVAPPSESFKEEGELDYEVKIKLELADHDYEDNNESLMFDDSLTYELVVKSEGGNIKSRDPINNDWVEESENVISDINSIKKNASKPTRKKNCVKTIRKPTRNKKCVKTTKKNSTSAEKNIDEKRIQKPTDNSLPCGLCTSTFENNDELQSHLSEHRQSQTCRICDEKFVDWQEIMSHRMDHLPLGKVQCHLCPQKYKSALLMELHFRSTHNSGEDRQTLRCRICNRNNFDSPKRLRVHYLDSHNTRNKKFYCDYCNKMFSRKHGLKSHIVSHLDDKPYVCDLCDKAFKLRHQLVIHKIKHIPERVYCKLCKRLYVSQSELDKHVCKYSAVVCPVCGKICKNRGESRRHFLRVHDKDNYYKCDRCPKTYKNRQSLVVHQNKHDGIRKHACEFCSAKFYDYSVLTKHRRTHTGIKPYVCKICRKGFTGNHNLKVHMRVHGQFLINKKQPDTDLSVLEQEAEGISIQSKPTF
ncbi:zinc finger protein 271 isoform X2 [Bicyclus anynana]|nr:zinc finger protein 271 isoform X2 [Bicyclus anynana]